jgi:murein DD-endopeptidase MepM/ murein hydrolase activator NlpD
MSKFSRIPAKVLLVLYLIFLHIILAVFIYEKLSTGAADVSALKENSVPAPFETAQTPLPMPSYEEVFAPTPAATPVDETTPAPKVYPPGRLLIPVKGVRRDQIQDNFNDSRDGGRAHHAIDIMAPKGTPVLAAADGEIARFFDSQQGGITIYQYSADKKLIYYYAHLERRDEAVREKQFVRQGTVIGYVGDTGNAGAGNFHLHFSIYEIEDPNRFWEGVNINPFPLLKNGIETD